MTSLAITRAHRKGPWCVCPAGRATIVTKVRGSNQRTFTKISVNVDGFAGENARMTDNQGRNRFFMFVLPKR